MERIAANIGIMTGVLGVLMAVGFVFLPASTTPEKVYVLLACIALSVAAVAGIGAWRSARRFALTATSAWVTVVCLAVLSMAAQHDQPSPPTPPTGTSGSASATPSISPAALPAGSVVFDDNFKSNKGWYTGRAPDGGSMVEQEPGALHVRVKASAEAASTGVPVPGSPAFTALRIDATMVRIGGNGFFGLQCQTTGTGVYDFWIDSDGSADIQAFATGDNSESSGRQLASGTASRWDPTQPHVLTAACVQVQGGTNLTFQIDGNVVATAFDNTHTESFEPFLIFESTQHAALDLNILHVMVAKLS